MNTPTPTPRTDSATYPADCLGTTLVTHRDCARELERELVTLTAEREQLRSDCENETKWAAHYLADAIASKARAERAEAAETVALAQWNGALERAMKAEADLAALQQCHDDNCRAVVKFAADLAAERERAERYRLASLKLDGELAAERARLDWVFRNCKVTADDFTTGNRDVYAIHDREDLGAAMKEGAQ
jgi:hypothetical protein